MKKTMSIVILIIIMLIIGACGKRVESNTGTFSTGTFAMTGSKDSHKATEENNTSEASETHESEVSTQEKDLDPGVKAILIQSASVDLDNDGINEELEALQVSQSGEDDSISREIEGVLKITSKNEVTRISFFKKSEGMTGVMTSFDFKDLDGDGCNDVFIVIPDAGAAFSLNYFFIYDYKKSKSISFTTDNNLSDFANGFLFEYKGEGKLEMKNPNYSFKCIFDIGSSNTDNEENNKSYDASWVDPTPVVIGDESRILLVKNNQGQYEVKVPIPVFGLATVDMIGEIDLFYSIDKSSNLVLKHFSVFDFELNGKKSIGSWSFK